MTLAKPLPRLPRMATQPLTTSLESEIVLAKLAEEMPNASLHGHFPLWGDRISTPRCQRSLSTVSAETTICSPTFAWENPVKERRTISLFGDCRHNVIP